MRRSPPSFARRNSAETGPAAVLGDRMLAKLIAAFEAGDEDAIVAIVADHPEFVGLTGTDGYTPLHWAAAPRTVSGRGVAARRGAAIPARAPRRMRRHST